MTLVADDDTCLMGLVAIGTGKFNEGMVAVRIRIALSVRFHQSAFGLVRYFFAVVATFAVNGLLCDL